MAASATTSTLAPEKFGAGNRACGQLPQDRLQPVVTAVMEMVRLGRRHQDPVDFWPEQLVQRIAAPDPEGREHLVEGVLEVAQRRRSGIERGQRVHQHDLPVEPGEMVAEERFDHMALVGLVAALHHRGQRALDRLVALGQGQWREGQRGRAFEVARHQETPWRKRRERIAFRARRAQIGGEQFRRLPRDGLVLRPGGVEAGGKAAPFSGERRSRRRGAGRKSLARPFGIGFFQQGQIEQPLAGIVDDIDDEGRGAWTKAGLAARNRAADESPRSAGSIAANGGPARSKRRDMVLEGEAGHVVVGLRLQPARKSGGARRRRGTPAAGSCVLRRRRAPEW